MKRIDSIPGRRRGHRDQRLSTALLVPPILLIPTLSRAHGLAVYISTPLTPPIEPIWVPLLFIGVLIAADRFILGDRVAKEILLRAESVSLLAYFAVLLFFGIQMSNLNTAPPPGFNLPHPAFFGMHDRIIWVLFAIGNGLGLVLFVVFRLFFCKRLGIWRTGPGWRVLLAGAGVYLIALLPYVLIGGLSHGWCGGYVEGECSDNIEEICHAVVRYAEANEGRLPDVETTEKLLATIEPYIEDPRRFAERPYFCSLESAYRKHPRPYIWDASFAGADPDDPAIAKRTEPLLIRPRKHDLTGHRPALHVRDLLEFRKALRAPPEQ